MDSERLTDFIATIPDLTSHRTVAVDGDTSVMIHTAREVAVRVANALTSGGYRISGESPPVNKVVTAVSVTGQLPLAVIEDRNGDIWQLRQRVYGSSWYRPGDSQPHGERDIALPATVLRAGQPWDRDEDGE